MRSYAPLLLIASILLIAQALTGVAAQSIQVAVLSYSSYIDSVDYHHVVGEVQNLGSSVLSQVRVAATLCDSSGQTTEIIEDYAMINLLEPQQKSPFDLFENATGNLCKVNVVNSTISNKMPYHDFQVLSQMPSRDSEGIYHVRGEVRNSGNTTALSVETVGTFYDGNMVVVQVGSALVTPSDLQPGQTGYYDVSSDDPAMSAQITRFALRVQSASPILPVPEFPVLAPSLVIALAGVLMLARRRSRFCLTRKA